MASSSSSFTSANARWIMVKNRLCSCGNGKKATLWISETSKNRNRLFFSCNACKYFKWWSPDNEECESIEEFVSNVPKTCAESKFSYDETQVGMMTANYKKLQRSLTWLKFITIFQCVLLAICICMTNTCNN